MPPQSLVPCSVGTADGLTDGRADGSLVGAALGAADGAADGTVVGDAVLNLSRILSMSTASVGVLEGLP